MARTSRQTKESFFCKERICLRSYGVTVDIQVTKTTIVDRLLAYLPPGYQLSSASIVDQSYSLITNNNNGLHQLYRGEEKIAEGQDIEEIFEAFDSDLRLQIGILVKNKLFVHAGVVGWQGKAIVIPGRSFSGKTTLVAALVKAGATYYSDEYAVLDTHGLVHSYPRLLSIRQKKSQRVKRFSVEELGGKSASDPLRIGIVVHTQYESEVQWNPNPMSSGQAVLALLDNTIVARLRPEFALSILAKAVANASSFEGKRGEAESFAAELLQLLSP